MHLTHLPPLDITPQRPEGATPAPLAPRPAAAQVASSPEDATLAAALALADAVHIQPLDVVGAMQIMIAEVRAELPLPGDALHPPPPPLGEAPAPELALAGEPPPTAVLPSLTAAPAPMSLQAPTDVQPPITLQARMDAPPPPIAPPVSAGAPHGVGARLEPLLFATGGLAEEPVVATAPQTLVQLFLQALPTPELLEPAVWLAKVMDVEARVQLALDRAVQATAAWRDVPTAVVASARETRDVVVAAITDEPPNPLWLRPEWLGLAPVMERYRRRRRRARRRLSDPDLHWRERDEDRERSDQEGG